MILLQAAGTTFLHEVREVKEDAICVSRLRKCGVIFVGKTNMHELGMGTTGSNPHHGYVECEVFSGCSPFDDLFIQLQFVEAVRHVDVRSEKVNFHDATTVSFMQGHEKSA